MCYDYLHLQLKKLMLRHVNILKITQQVRQETEPKSISASPHTVHTYIFLLDVHLGKKKKWRRGCRFFSEFHSGFLKNGDPQRFQVQIRLIFRTHPFRYFWKLRETI